jgi:hypothetical protein
MLSNYSYPAHHGYVCFCEKSNWWKEISATRYFIQQQLHEMKVSCFGWKYRQRCYLLIWIINIICPFPWSGNRAHGGCDKSTRGWFICTWSYRYIWGCVRFSDQYFLKELWDWSLYVILVLPIALHERNKDSTSALYLNILMKIHLDVNSKLISSPNLCIFNLLYLWLIDWWFAFRPLRNFRSYGDMTILVKN